jgi:hypothetical protein
MRRSDTSSREASATRGYRALRALDPFVQALDIGFRHREPDRVLGEEVEEGQQHIEVVGRSTTSGHASDSRRYD